jgi:hypothetical protein
MIRKKIFVLVLAGSLFASFARLNSASADPAKDFVMSCTYGVLAGTLVGTATLAFSDKPGDNLNRIARGASIGLYAGILLGLYVVNLSSTSEEDSQAMKEAPKLQVYPIISESHGVEGGAVRYSLFQF